MKFIKKCSVGEMFVGVYEKEKGVFVCVDGLQFDETYSQEEVDFITDEYKGRLLEDYVADNKEDAINEMRNRICDLLNEYFFDEEDFVS